jgi:hypothetical protein
MGVNEMTRRLPCPWRAEKFSGGYVARDANGFAVAYVYGRSTEDEAMAAKQMTTLKETPIAAHSTLSQRRDDAGAAPRP